GALLSRPPCTARDAEAPGAEPLAEMRDRSRAERDVDLRIEREDALALRLGVAAADGDDRVRMRTLPRAGIAEISGQLRVWLLAPAAVAALPGFSLRMPARALMVLVTNRDWLRGFALESTGFGLYVVALALAPLTLVQSLAAGGIGILAFVSARVGGRALPRH